MSTVHLDAANNRYVLQNQAGVSSLDFDVCMNEAVALSEAIGRPDLAPSDQYRGSMMVLIRRQELLSQFQRHPASSATWFAPGTTAKVKAVLEEARTTSRILRIFYGDAMSGRDWLEENDVLGRIGRSSGYMKVPLLLEAGAHGGHAILTNCIVRILDGRSGEEVYRMANYREPQFDLSRSKTPGYVVDVNTNGILQASFKTIEKAADYVGFMLGIFRIGVAVDEYRQFVLSFVNKRQFQ